MQLNQKKIRKDRWLLRIVKRFVTYKLHIQNGSANKPNTDGAAVLT